MALKNSQNDTYDLRIRLRSQNEGECIDHFCSFLTFSYVSCQVVLLVGLFRRIELYIYMSSKKLFYCETEVKKILGNRN